MTTRDPETVYVVLNNEGGIALARDDASEAELDLVRYDHGEPEWAPFRVAIYDLRNEAERAHLEEGARILRNWRDEFFADDFGVQAGDNVKRWLAAERKRREGK